MKKEEAKDFIRDNEIEPALVYSEGDGCGYCDRPLYNYPSNEALVCKDCADLAKVVISGFFQDDDIDESIRVAIDEQLYLAPPYLPGHPKELFDSSGFGFECLKEDEYFDVDGNRHYMPCENPPSKEYDNLVDAFKAYLSVFKS